MSQRTYKEPRGTRFLGALRRKPSAGLAVRRRLVAARAVLCQLETIRRVTTVLLGDVVALLALRACQSDLGANVLRLACHGDSPFAVAYVGVRLCWSGSGGGARTRDLTIMSRAL